MAAFDARDPNPRLVRTALFYISVVGGSIALFLWVRTLGAGMQAPAAPDGQPLFGATGVKDQGHALLHVLLALPVVIVAARCLGLVFKRFGQPPVIGEVLAGILLGPSLMGRVWPEASAFLLPGEVAPLLGIIAQVGVVLYMFLVGLELNPTYMRKSPHAALAISHASIVAPFLLGASFALYLYPHFATSDVPFTVFALFLGVSMSVTAFPVLARILTDRRLSKTRLGSIAITCASVDDVTAWCLLAFVVGVAQAKVEDSFNTIGYALVYIAFVLLVVRRAARWVVAKTDHLPELTQGWMAVIFVAFLLSAFATEWIGIHALFGAFVVGAVIPHDSLVARDLRKRLEDLVVVLLLPAFFAYTGLRTQIGLVSTGTEWLIVGAIIAIASLGKFGGSLAAARLAGMSWRDSAAIGTLMNTRGLMELIVLNIGLDLKVLSPTLFAMLVLMAIVTTVATTPVLDLLNRDGALLSEREPAALPEPRPQTT
jgi:Kef-type K+ transport system membrane component KefB